ncbi:MAG: hypothetical protein M3Y06_06590, partial [Actinomycetota bacterium]|nr:hypothetical protein [Actinomycetota bacterium]
MTPPAAHALIAELSAAGVSRGTLVGVSTAPAIGTGLASGAQQWALAAPDSIALIAAIEAELQPRWVWWGRPVPELFVASDVRPTACWDVGAVHQLLFGGARPTGAAAWAAVHDLPATGVPATGQLDLLGEHGDDTGDADQPVRPDGYLRPEWVSGGWRRDPDRLAAWAGV